MGYLLYREVKVWAPRTLTKGEKLTALVLADNADDRSRETRDSVVDPELMEEAMVPDERSMRRIIARLQEELVIRNIVAGHNGRTAKFKFLSLAPADWVGTTGYRKRSEVGGQKSPAYNEGAPEAPAENHPPTDGVAGCFSPSRRVKTTRPRPPTNKTTTPAPAEPSAPSTAGGGGGDQQEQAQAFLQSLPEPWAAGPVDARKLAPKLLDAIHTQGWDLDDTLATELTKNPGGIDSFRAVLPRRIANLTKKPTAKTRASPPAAALPDWCGDIDCDPTDRYRTTEDAQGYRTTRPCPACHPDHAKDRAA
jgi:hypothetical protein